MNANLGGTSTSILQMADLEIISLTECQAIFYGNIKEVNVCAWDPEGKKDSCNGDSGGPFVCLAPEEDRYILAGIVSWGVGCAVPGYPGVYAAVSFLLDFVYDTIGGKWHNFLI